MRLRESIGCVLFRLNSFPSSILFLAASARSCYNFYVTYRRIKHERRQVGIAITGYYSPSATND
jgi:hypothetical protein